MTTIDTQPANFAVDINQLLKQTVNVGDTLTAYGDSLPAQVVGLFNSAVILGALASDRADAAIYQTSADSVLLAVRDPLRPQIQVAGLPIEASKLATGKESTLAEFQDILDWLCQELNILAASLHKLSA